MEDARTSQSSLFSSNPKSLLPFDDSSDTRSSLKQSRLPRWRFGKQGPAYEPIRMKHKLSARQAASHVDDQNLVALILLYLTLTIPILVLISWWMFVYRNQNLDMIKSAPIGGRLDLVVAKGIDVLCSAILAPLGMAFLNLLWFRLARISVCNEKDKGAVSLKAILELSTTYGGTYDPWKLWTLFRASRHRFTLFGILTLLSAISTSLFVNVIAYEAIYVKQPFSSGTNWTLSQLPSYADNTTSERSTKNFGTDELRQLNLNFVSSMYSISYAMDRDMDDDNHRLSGVYINPNVTKHSLKQTPTQIQQLWNVPAIRLGVACKPANITDFSISFTDAQTGDIAQVTAVSDDAYYNGSTELSRAQLRSLYSQRFYLTLQTSESALLAVYEIMAAPVAGFSIPEIPPQTSKFGTIYAANVADYKNETIAGYNLKRKDNIYGIICRIQRQHGKANLTASDLQSARKWSIDQYNFEEDKPRNTTNFLSYVASQFSNYRPPQSTGLHWDAVGEILGTGAGKGPNYWNINDGVISQNKTIPVFSANPVNFTTYAYNFLYAASRMETAIWDIVMANPERLKDARPYTVGGRQMVLKYRICYIPGLLVAGLITLSLAAAIVFGMTWYSLGTLSAHTDRVVDGLRFVADFTAAVREDENLADANKWSRHRLDRFGQSLRLRYIVDHGSLRLRSEFAERELQPLLKEKEVVDEEDTKGDVKADQQVEIRGIAEGDGMDDMLIRRSEPNAFGRGSLRGKA
ncbi:hypothetical protein B0J11DRAFT_174255 [Dendryphion nanum]|uniref:Uncharacterized protein n=1 Tax=Dendryphion nanum TaxID=256645 RepID=A0A9P9EDI1_9PLEO|nr:hypothetical protein B0J11DRAFT_174255 [Dendryphion nanum]